MVPAASCAARRGREARVLRLSGSDRRCGNNRRCPRARAEIEQCLQLLLDMVQSESTIDAAPHHMLPRVGAERSLPGPAPGWPLDGRITPVDAPRVDERQTVAVSSPHDYH